MKHNNLTVFVLILAALLLAACAPAATATAVPEATATQPPVPTNTTAAPAVETSPYPSPEAETYPAPEATAASSDPGAYPPSGGEVRFTLLADQSEARYRITEQLVGNDLPNEVVGKTKAVTGEVVVGADGKIDPARSKFVIQAGTIETDNARRDGYVRNNTLSTAQYPEIVFVPTAIDGLADLFQTQGEVNFTLTGQLTIRGVTKEVVWTVTGTVEGDIARGTASTNLTFADFNLVQPRVPVVLSIKDDIRLEMDVVLQRTAN